MKPPLSSLVLLLAFFLCASCGSSRLCAQNGTVLAFAAWGRASYFITNDGTLWVANDAPYGDLPINYPKQVATNVRSIYPGDNRCLFIKNDDSLWAVGRNENGELADGTQTYRSSPVQVGTDVRAVACGINHVLIIKKDNTLWGAGLNHVGQLGLGTSATFTRPYLSPVKIADNVDKAAARLNSSAFIKKDGSLWVMGYNEYAMFGPIGPNTVTPLQIVSNASAISFGMYFYSYVTSDGILYSSGRNNFGQLGDGTTRAVQNGPAARITDNVALVSCGDDHVLVLKNDGSLWAAGLNEWSQFGNGTLSNSSRLIQIASGVSSASAGWRHSLYSKTDGSLWAMGYNQYGELADGTTNERNVAIKLTQPSVTGQPTSVSVSLGASASLSADVIGTGKINFQWLKDGSPVSGANFPALSLPSTTTGSAGNYALVASNWLGSVTSSIATLAVTYPISITTQPAAQTVVLGNAASFSVVATGSSPIAYQWSKDGVAISGATSATYSIASTIAASSGSYSVIVSNSVGSVVSTAVPLVLNPSGVPPSITSQPTSKSVIAGSSVTFSVIASGTASLTYQWRKNGTAIAGATSPSLTLSSSAASDVGSYSVVVANNLGSVTSSAAVLTVDTPPVITLQPKGLVVVEGSGFSLSVSASGSGSLAYQWRKNGVAIVGATTSSYSIPSCLVSDAGSYDVTISTAESSTTSLAATVTVNVPPRISTQPVSTVTYAGINLSLTIAASGTSPISFQWYKDGVAINGALSSVYTLSGPLLNKAGAYDVVVTNVAGSVRSNSTLVFTPPHIVTQPTPASVALGAGTTFSVVAGGSPSLTYQWYRNGTAVPGATSDRYTFGATTVSDAGTYYVIVSNAYGTTRSSSAILTVSPTPTAPSISVQPVSQTVTSGLSVTFSVTTSGTGPFTYVWRKDGGQLTASNSPSLTLSNATSTNAGGYSVTITNALGSVTSSVATLAVVEPATTFTQRRRVSAIGNSLWSFAYGNKTMVVVGSPGLIYSSNDGVTWTQRASGTNEWLVGVAYGNSQFVAVGANGRILRSVDGTLWTYAANEGTIFRLNGVIYADKRWVAVGENGVIITSTDANIWSPVVSGTSHFLHGIAYSQGSFIVTGGSGTILSSSDGTTWSVRSSGTSSDLEACAVVGNYFVTVGGAGECLFSPVALGGANWTNNSKYKPNTTARLRAISSGGGAAIAFSEDGTAYYLPSVYSAWVQLPTSTQTTFLASGFAENRFYGLGTGEVIVQSEPFFEGKLGNLSTRGQTGLGSDVLITGVVVTGTSPKQMLIRAAGPALSSFGIRGFLPQPILTLFDKDGNSIASNTAWNQSPNDSDIRSASIAVGAFAFPENSGDSALLIRLLPGSYTAQVTGVNNSTGAALIEVYDTERVQAAQSKLVNISSRGVVGRDQDIIIPGVSVSGSSGRMLLIRAVGPSLGSFGVDGFLVNPTISVVQNVNGTNMVLATNDDWEVQNQSATFTSSEVRLLSTKAGAFALPSGSKDAALLFSTAANTNYTVLVSGANGETGVALVEIYDVTGL